MVGGNFAGFGTVAAIFGWRRANSAAKPIADHCDIERCIQKQTRIQRQT
jgi:hypothetical protein